VTDSEHPLYRPTGEVGETSCALCGAVEIEAALNRIWCEVLQTDNVDSMDNFFALGGHSLKAMQVVVRARRELRSEAVTLADVFRSPNLKSLAETLEKRASE